MRNRVLLLCLALLLIGCGARLRKHSQAPTGNEAFFVFGLQPANYMVQVFPGSLGKDGKFHQNKFDFARYNRTADMGYAVGSAKPGTVLAITRVYVDYDYKRPFGPCGDAETIVFTAQAGVVVYLADLNYRIIDNALNVEYSSDIQRARLYLAANYPLLEPQLVQGKFDILKTDFSCSLWPW